jgi:hypothetical protein
MRSIKFHQAQDHSRQGREAVLLFRLRKEDINRSNRIPSSGELSSSYSWFLWS